MYYLGEQYAYLTNYSQRHVVDHFGAVKLDVPSCKWANAQFSSNVYICNDSIARCQTFRQVVHQKYRNHLQERSIGSRTAPRPEVRQVPGQYFQWGICTYQFFLVNLVNTVKLWKQNAYEHNLTHPGPVCTSTCWMPEPGGQQRRVSLGYCSLHKQIIHKFI